MATWNEIGWQNLDSAHLLLEHRGFRSCVSRAYFGLYALITGRLMERGFVASSAVRDNPGHQQALMMLEHNLLNQINSAAKRRTARAATTVQRARLVADYVPGQTIDRELALAVLRDAHLVARALGITRPL